MIKIKDIGWDVDISSECERVKIIKERGLPTELVLTQFDRDERDLVNYHTPKGMWLPFNSSPD